jgi:hypothetical protein
MRTCSRRSLHTGPGRRCSRPGWAGLRCSPGRCSRLRSVPQQIQDKGVVVYQHKLRHLSGRAGGFAYRALVQSGRTTSANGQVLCLNIQGSESRNTLVGPRPSIRISL